MNLTANSSNPRTLDEATSRGTLSKPTVVMLTNDRQKFDRRILQEADSLEAAGWQVTIIGLPLDPGDAEIDPRAVRIGMAIERSSREARILRFYRAIRRLIAINAMVMKFARAFAWRFLVDQENFYSHLYADTLSKFAPDVFVAHDLPMLPAAKHAAERCGAKLVYDSHELYSEQELSGWEKRRWNEIEAKYIGSCDRVITINPSIAAELRKRYGTNNVDIIYNAEHSADVPDNPKMFHKIFDLPPRTKILLMQGAFSANRNLETLVESMTYVQTKLIHLVLLGDGPMRLKLEKIVKQKDLARRVHFHNAVPQKELLYYTASADAGIIPYQATCLNNYLCTPNKLFEFIAAGLPILANDLPELRKIIDGNDIGLLGNMHGPENIARLIDEFFGNSSQLDYWHTQTQQARKTICWEVEEKKLIAIYDALR